MKIKSLPILFLFPLLLTACFNQEKSDWVVKINKEKITKDQIQTGFNNLSDQAKSQIPGDKQGQFIVNQLIQNEILYQEAVKSTLNLNEDYQAYLKQLTSQFEFQKKQGLIDLFVKENIDKDIAISEQEVLTAFEQNKNTVFKAYEERSVSHIVVETEKKAKQIYTKLTRGNKFETLAKKESIDEATAKNNGVIPGKFTENNLSPEFKEVIFGLKNKGNYSKPVKSNSGYHIFKLNSVNTVKAKKYDEVKDFLKQQLFTSKRKEKLESLLDSVKENYKIEQNENLTNESSNQENSTATNNG